jgi:predicted RNase H-like nuclease (RuvC/YqgF family)
MLLNEFLKEHRKVEAQDRRLQEQQKQIEMLTARLEEQAEQIRKVNDKLEMNRPAPQMVVNDR